MKAIVQNAYGSTDVLKLEETDTPTIRENEVLVRVRAASVNAGDFFLMRGSPWLARFAVRFPKPKNHILGWDVAGHVEAAGEKVTRFRPGDEVFGTCKHAFAEYVSAAEDRFVIKPANLSFEQAAAVPTAALTLLKELLESGKVKPVIDRIYLLPETPQAIGYVGHGHARGKVVITVRDQGG